MTRLLTIVALRASVGGHGAVAGVVLPLLDTNTHVGAGVLLAGGAGTCGKSAMHPNNKQTHYITDTTNAVHH